MSFDEKIAALIQRIPELVVHLQTEEATKNALIMPFIAALGYDIFNPREVIPEFTADVGTKKGEKVDYAVMYGGEVIFLVECKKVDTDLSHAEMSQLFRYFQVTNARIAILTNGVQYNFYSDLEAPNKMDSKPFLELDLSDPKTPALKEVKKLAKDDFNLDQVLSVANELKYISAIKKYLFTQYESKCPDEDFVKFFFISANLGNRFTATAKEQFTPIVKKAFEQFINERIEDRLRSALQKEEKQLVEDSQIGAEEVKSEIITTEEELEGFRIVRAIIAKILDPERVIYRDTKSYMGILLDDNNRKPICRLCFNTKQKSIITFDQDRREVRHPIDALTDLYKYADEITKIVEIYQS
ncbi:type I restriction enzyme HsdR N-terminal domain-containing protein [Thermosynechococcaceae cyanobacterium BACA0444]|uniref:Type I restriction enzyme HsdR N-terminal domain-containing protein n=1 Tax=Pseudocalidococcus azoricus BACA0444 TaxID=2918990 RepID=A0AAE4FS66_9CYAN|nr:type I restriction endonuclease [Pseudocalidococcus azoricus]MDS3860798.1 type I restriction enzyme HsdR N-terminal domain-containing protein [Pseudocalidococcus azoricus BACA0444]